MLNANWIQVKEDIGAKAPVFQKIFNTEKKIESAFLYISSKGVYEAILNGERVGDFILAPGWTSYKHRIQYQKYNIANLLKKENFLNITVASGWYSGEIAKWWKPSSEDKLELIAKIEVVYEDGTKEEIYTNETWKASLSPYEFCDIYDGFKFDSDFDLEFNLETTVSSNNDKNILIKQSGEIIKEQEKFKPIALITTPKGEKVIDFGQNLAGYVEIKLNAKKGDKVTLSFAEILDKDGNFYNENYRTAKCRYEYICKDGEQTFKPTLTFYGYRYIRLDEYPVDIDLDSFTSIALYSDMKRIGKFECSNKMINKLYNNALWGQRSNFVDVPTDCPQRDERMGWLGDAQVFIKAASLNYDVNKFFTKWLNDMALNQFEDGLVPVVVPMEKEMRTVSAAWADAVAICPWQLYISYGNKEILSLMFEPIKKWVDYVTKISAKENLWFGGDHFCDWLELGAKHGQLKGDTRGDLIGSAFYAKSTEILCKIGDILNKDVTKYKELYENIVNAFNTEFDGTYKTQTEYILPLQFNISKKPEELCKKLVEKIHEDGDKLQTGFVGTPYILHVLTKFGYSDLAYTLLLREEFPSWIYPITKGATTIWEHWDGILPSGDLWPVSMNSYNHYAYGAVVDWMYGACAGINPIESAPGFEKALITPNLDDRLDWVKAELETPYGLIKSAWHHENCKVIYNITTPVDAVIVINGEKHEVTKGEYTF